MSTAMVNRTEGTMLLIEDQSVEQRWEKVRKYKRDASKFAVGFVWCQIMAGLELLQLRKVHGKQGKRSDLATSPHDAEKLAWPEMCQQFGDISDDTARRWMGMADGMRADIKKMSGKEMLAFMLETPPSAWTQEQDALATQFLQKTTDGKTQADFLIDLGLAKKPQGSGATGREKGSEGNPGKKLTPAEQHNELLRIAHEDWVETRKLLTGYREKFVVLTDDEVTAQIATLEQALNARKAWLKQPANQRDIPAIAVMFKKTV